MTIRGLLMVSCHWNQQLEHAPAVIFNIFAQYIICIPLQDMVNKAGNQHQEIRHELVLTK